MKKPHPNKPATYPDEFRRNAKRMSKYFNLKGCRTENCINNRIKNKNSPKLNNLVEHNFAYRLLIELWTNPHPIYKEILDLDDEEYDILVEDKRK